MPIYVTDDITMGPGRSGTTGAGNLMRNLYEAHPTNAQLLAALLGIADRKAEQLLYQMGVRELASLLSDEMAHLTGLKARQFRTLTAAAALSIRLKEPPAVPGTIRCPEDIADAVFPAIGQAYQEKLCVLMLSARNQLIGRRMVYRRNVNSSTVRPDEVLKDAVIAGIPNIAIVHSHPSGDLTPRAADRNVTEELQEAGWLLDINLLGHVVIAPDRSWVSLKQEGIVKSAKTPQTLPQEVNEPLPKQ